MSIFSKKLLPVLLLSFGFLLLSSQQAAAAPTVVTLPTDMVFATQAQLFGEVTNMGGASEVWVGFVYDTQYHADASDYAFFNDTCVTESTCRRTGTGEFWATMGNLSSNTTYHYRAIARDSWLGAITAQGVDMTFTTDSPDEPLWISPTGHVDPEDAWNNETDAYDENIYNSCFTWITGVNVTLSEWLYLNHDPSGVDVDGVRFITTMLAGEVFRAEIDVSEDGVNWDRVYTGAWEDYRWRGASFSPRTVTQLRIRFARGLGHTGDSIAVVSEVDFREYEECGDTAPDGPTLSSPANGATGQSTSPTLDWNAISSWGINCAGNTNTYEVFLEANDSTPDQSRGTVAEGTTSMSVSGLDPGTTYYWKTRASNGALSSDSPIWSFTTEVSPSLNVSPTTVNLSATQGTGTITCGGSGQGACPSVWNSGGGTLSWSTSPTSPDGWLSWTPASDGNGPTTLWVSATINGLAAGSYQKQVVVTGAAGTQNSPQTVTVNLTVTEPAATPTVDNVTISADPIVADGLTQYSITIKASDSNGVSDLNDIRTAINLQGDEAPNYRGYFRWDDSAMGGNWLGGTCYNGGNPEGYFGKYVGAGGGGYGKDYVNLISCTTSTSGNQRTVNFVFSANTNWLQDGPLTNNDISGRAFDDGGLNSAWKNHDLNFGVTGSYLNVSPMTLNFTATEGAGTITCELVDSDPNVPECSTVWNTGGGTLSWTAPGSPNEWLSWVPGSFTGNSTTLWESVTIDGLVAGFYSKQFTVLCDPLSSCQAGGQSETVTVNLTINEACVDTVPDIPTLSSPTDGATDVPTNTSLSWAHSGSWGINCAGNTNTFKVYFGTNSNPPLFDTVSSSTTSKAVTNLVNNTTYYWKIVADNGVLTASSPVWDFTPTPSLNVSPTTVNLSATEGAGDVTCSGDCPIVQNVGGGTLSWTATDGDVNDWLWWIPASGGDGPTTVWVSATIDGLDPGDYQEQFDVVGTVGTQSSPQTVTVNLTITQATASISGAVWLDKGAGANAGNGVWDADESAYTTTVLTISRGGGNTVGTVAGSYDFGSFSISPPESVTVSLDTSTLPSGWGGTGVAFSDGTACGTASTSCLVTLNDGDSKVINFGIWDVPGGWFQVIDGDIHSEGYIENYVP